MDTTSRPGLVSRTGMSVVTAVDNIVGAVRLAVASMREAYAASGSSVSCIHEIWLQQVRFTGLHALTITAAAGIITGAIVIIQSMAILPQVGAADSLGKLIALIVIREVGPLLVAFIVIGRSATATSVELGTMVVGDEIAVLRSLGIPPRAYVVFPRLAGITVATMALLVYFDLAAVAGGYVVSFMFVRIAPSFFLGSVAHHLRAVDLTATLAKGFLFGGIIASIACYFGLSVEPSPTEIPKAALRTVVHAILLCLVADLVITFASLGR
ncbi:MAG: ABC transporter permease [Candidatus Eisenbacteria bacterium]|nr:ABC transporter permease [Candidatus Eisenbacteria bacterium]